MKKIIILLGFILSLVGCSHVQQSVITEPTTAKPQLKQSSPPINGSIFNANNPSMFLSFADPKPRQIGDILTIRIVENTNASTNSNNNVTRNSSSTASVPTLDGLPGRSFLGIDLEAKSGNNFKSQGSAAGKNAFTGTITVTVTDLYPNGNLVIAGEKQMVIGNSTEFIKISGVIDPKFVDRNNTIESTKVADAKIEYRGEGQIADSTFMPWLARFFMSVLPF